VKSNFLQSS